MASEIKKDKSFDVLSIVIPTYNRVEILKYNLNFVIEEIIEYSIPIYISDDSTNDETKIMIDNLKNKYQKIYYFKNVPSLGHDRNCIASLKIPDSEYIWYLGDSMIIKKGSIAKLLSIITKESPDFISFKEENRKIDLPTNIINNTKIIFHDFAWHLTMSGVTVYKKNRINLNNFDLKQFKNFPQLALIFHGFKDVENTFFWLNESLIFGNLNKKSYWSKNVFEVFFKDLKSTLLNLPQHYSESDVDTVLKKHNINSSIFGYRNMVMYRMLNIYRFNVLKFYFQEFYKHTNCNIIFLFILSVFPKRILMLIYKIFKILKGK